MQPRIYARAQIKIISLKGAHGAPLFDLRVTPAVMLTFNHAVVACALFTFR